MKLCYLNQDRVTRTGKITDDEVIGLSGVPRVISMTGEDHQRSAKIAYLSAAMMMKSGGIIATGTVSGAGIAAGRVLRDGGLPRVDVRGLGTIENRLSSKAA